MILKRIKPNRISWRDLIYFIVIISPFIDLLNNLVFQLGLSLTFSPGQFIRTSLLLIMLMMLAIGYRYFLVIMVAVIGCVIVRNLIYLLHYGASFYLTCTQDLRYVYVLTFYFLLSGAYRTSQITWEEMYDMTKKFVIVIAVASLISVITGVGIDYAGGKRFFTEVNALTAILVYGGGVFLYETITSRDGSKYKNLFVTAVIIYVLLFQATKAGLIGICVCFLYVMAYEGLLKGKFLKLMILLGVAVSGIYVIYYHYTTGAGMEILNRWKYFCEHMDFWSFLLSGRDLLFQLSFKVWKRDILFVLFGVGYANAYTFLQQENSSLSYPGAEMDLFDIGFYYGLIALVLIGIPIVRNVWKAARNVVSQSRKSFVNFFYIILFVLSFLGGHILSSPLAGILFCLSSVMVADRQKDMGKE